MTTSVKVKRKKSVVEGKRMPLYLQIICDRRVKRMVLDYRLAAEEWIAEKEMAGRINRLIPTENRSNPRHTIFSRRKRLPEKTISYLCPPSKKAKEE